MIRLPLSLVAILAVLTASASAGQGGRNINADLKPGKAERTDVREVVTEKDGADVPPEVRTPRADARMEKLRLLIVEGVRTKQLTPGETTSVTHELGRIEREEETFKHNGRVGSKERHELNRDINKLHERLWEKTHNGAKPTEPLAN